MKKKILYIITKADVGGAQKYVHDLAANLDTDAFEAKIIYGGRDLKWLSNKTYPLGFFWNDWLALVEFIKLLKAEQPHIIHLNSSKAGVIGSLAAWLYKITHLTSNFGLPKVVFTAHGWVFNPTNYLTPPVRWFYVLLHRATALCQDLIINVSEYDRKLALQYKIAPKKKLVTIYNGIDPNITFLEKLAARKALINKLESNVNLPPVHGRWVGSIGRLTKEKNYETLIETAPQIPNAYFFIIGEGREETDLQSQITKLKLADRFFIIKPTGKDALYLKAFDVFVMSSIKEGLPYTLLEAMRAELPIVVTRAGGMPEVIHDKKNGLVVNQKDPLALRVAILEFLGNFWWLGKLDVENRKKIESIFNLRRMVKESEKQYLKFIIY